MTAQTDAEGPGLRMAVDVHQRRSDRVCLTLRVSGVVAFELQLVAPIVDQDVDATLWGQGIHRKLLDWPADLPYVVAKRKDGRGALCPPRGTLQLAVGAQTMTDARARFEPHRDRPMVRIDTASLGSIEIASSDASSTTKGVRIRHRSTDEAWRVVDGDGALHLLVDGACGAVNVSADNTTWRTRFHLPTSDRRGPK